MADKKTKKAFPQMTKENAPYFLGLLARQYNYSERVNPYTNNIDRALFERGWSGIPLQETK